VKEIESTIIPSQRAVPLILPVPLLTRAMALIITFTAALKKIYRKSERYKDILDRTKTNVLDSLIFNLLSPKHLS
jgi:hypothetical protein